MIPCCVIVVETSGGEVQLHDSVINLYPQASDSTGTMAETMRQNIKARSSAVSHPTPSSNNSNAEQSAWQLMQTSLDVFVQRVSVLEQTQAKHSLRGWYEGLLEIGQKAFASV